MIPPRQGAEAFQSQKKKTEAEKVHKLPSGGEAREQKVVDRRPNLPKSRRDGRSNVDTRLQRVWSTRLDQPHTYSSWQAGWPTVQYSMLPINCDAAKAAAAAATFEHLGKRSRREHFRAASVR